jgi:N-acetylglucosaminyl-diphospho-decaprenol L-rhamnosyltransferase
MVAQFLKSLMLLPSPLPGDTRSIVELARLDLSIVIVTHNGRDMALETLESAMAHVGGASVEWVIVDCGSTDGTPDAIEARWPEIEVMRLPNIGFAAGNNAGFKVARGRYLLALNPDTLVRWGEFKALVDAMDERPQIGASSVIQEEDDGSFQSMRRDPSVVRALSEALWLRKLPGLKCLQERVLDPTIYHEEQTADWVVGAVLMLRREALEEVGGFDERFFMYSEEADLCRRMRIAGWEVRHLPVMRILHWGGKPNPRLAAQASFSRLEYAGKHFGRLRATLYRGALAVNHVTRLVGHAVRGGQRERVIFERNALMVVLGLAEPPFGRRTDS